MSYNKKYYEEHKAEIAKKRKRIQSLLHLPCIDYLYALDQLYLLAIFQSNQQPAMQQKAHYFMSVWSKCYALDRYHLHIS